jgi:hypothetical protein
LPKSPKLPKVKIEKQKLLTAKDAEDAKKGGSLPSRGNLIRPVSIDNFGNSGDLGNSFAFLSVLLRLKLQFSLFGNFGDFGNLVLRDQGLA